MRIEGLENQLVEFKIINYEFPNSNDKEYDGNWLQIYLNVKSKLGNWQTIDSSLLTWEVQEIIDWFKLLLENKTQTRLLEFIEPNISFELTNSFDNATKRIKIIFDLESKPRSAKENVEYFVEFEANEIQLKKLINDLESELSKYPLRS